MGKTAIVYYSQHHGNTKKVLDAIAGYDNDIMLTEIKRIVSDWKQIHQG